jgi:glycosyltransferase involved in cell wall biosynthesis
LENDIDVIHTHFLRENTIALLSKSVNKKPRVVYTNHIILRNNLITRISNRILSRRQHAVLPGCTPGAEQLIANGIPKKLISVVHNGVDPEFWAKADGGEIRKELGLTGDIFVMLYPARFAEGKGHAFLLEAAALLKTMTDLPFRLLLAGDGPLLEETKTLAGRLNLSGEVIFLGFRKDMQALLGAADLCVNASASESFNMSILEGMAAGLPVVATDVGGTGEMVVEGSGLLVRYNNTAEMAEALYTMLENTELREKCAKQALYVVKKRFTAKTMIDKVFSYYT